MNLLLTPDLDPAVRPCAGGLLAGTLALMTCWADPDAASERARMAHKICSNLHLLRDHPDLGPGLQQVAGRLHQRWVLIAHGASLH